MIYFFAYFSSIFATFMFHRSVQKFLHMKCSTLVAFCKVFNDSELAVGLWEEGDMGTKFDWLEENKCLFNVGSCQKVTGNSLTVPKLGTAVDSQDDVWGKLNTWSYKKKLN